MTKRSPTALLLVLVLGLALCAAAPAMAMRVPDLTEARQQALERDFATSLQKLKGPYTENFCVCRKTGEKKAVMDKSGRITSPCGQDPLFCAAFRAPWGEALAREGVWIANVFSRDLWLWDSIPDHHDLVRGYLLEKYFVDTNPSHKLAQLRSFGGLSGSEFETAASPRFFERYLAEPGFDDNRHFPLAWELQRRFFVRDDLGQVEKVRQMAVRIQAAQPKFKPLRDAIHNQLSASLVPKVEAWGRDLPAGSLRNQVEALAAELRKLTTLNDAVLVEQLGQVSDPAARAQLEALVPPKGADPVAALTSLGRLMATVRRTVAARRVSTADARRLIDLGITAGAVMQARGGALLESGGAMSAARYIELLSALNDAAYGAGLLVAREHVAAADAIARLAADPKPSRAAFARDLRQAGRLVEWAQVNALLPYAEVWAEWTLLMPQVATIGDDVLRASPLLLFAQVYERLEGWAGGAADKDHDFFGASMAGDARVLNPGLAAGILKVAPKTGAYTRDHVIALPETPTELQPAAGILTRGEGNVLSHVQLLARALGIPNVVVSPKAYATMLEHDGESVFLAATPGGRTVLRTVEAMTPEERTVYAEYTGNEVRRGQSTFASGASRLHIDVEKIDLSVRLPLSLSKVRRADSGRTCGPKGAFLGELKHLFPDKVSRGIVVPFGAYRDHYERARVVVPPVLRGAGVATDGEALSAFVERTWGEFFGRMVPAGTDAAKLSQWVSPRLDVIRHTILSTPVSAELKAAIRDGLDKEGLLRGAGKNETVGCFVRSDTNVEDLDGFNGAGLNLTLFNIGSLDDIYGALLRVWASPFELRSFSWRQTLIDQPLWVLPSVVILESIPSDKSGVLVTCDIETGETGKMVVATSEGVGGAVDGTSAETLLWTPQRTEVLTLFKSPWRTVLLPDGGTRQAPSSGSERVLSDAEVAEIVAAGAAVEKALEPARDRQGKARPWDIEFGFAAGKLWLFQSRPFIGNESVKNLPALARLDGADSAARAKDVLSLEEVIP